MTTSTTATTLSSCSAAIADPAAGAAVGRAAAPPAGTEARADGATVEPVGNAVVVIRTAGAAEPRDARWRERLADAVLRHPGVAVAGAKRLAPDGSTFSMGEMIVHPKGFHHVGRGTDASAYRFVEEVDAVCAGAVAIRTDAAMAAGGVPRDLSGLGLVELCLELRGQGHRVISVPDVAVTDGSSAEPGATARAAFRRRFGFDVLAADLDEVRVAAAAGRPGLAWNLRFHHPAMGFEKYEQREAFHWHAYDGVDSYRQRADHLVRLVRHVTPAGRVLDLGCGDGLFAHLAAMTGLEVVGIDPCAVAIRQAAQMVARREYPGPPPRFAVGTGESPPVAADGVSTIMLLDVIEHLPNPVRVLRRCRELLAPGGHLLVSTPAWQHGRWSDPVYHVCEYTEAELVRQIHAATDLEVVSTGRIGGVYRDIVVVARK